MYACVNCHVCMYRQLMLQWSWWSVHRPHRRGLKLRFHNVCYLAHRIHPLRVSYDGPDGIGGGRQEWDPDSPWFPNCWHDRWWRHQSHHGQSPATGGNPGITQCIPLNLSLFFSLVLSPSSPADVIACSCWCLPQWHRCDAWPLLLNIGEKCSNQVILLGILF